MRQGLGDLRTRKGREAEVLRQIADYGGFSVFWITEFHTRAAAADRLEKARRIRPLASTYPWCAWAIIEEPRK